MIVLEDKDAVELHLFLYNVNQTLKKIVAEGNTGSWILKQGEIYIGSGEHLSLVEGVLKPPTKLSKLVDITTLPVFPVNGDLLFQSHKKHKNNILKIVISEGSLTVLGETKSDGEYQSCHKLPMTAINKMMSSIDNEKSFVSQNLEEEAIEVEFENDELYCLMGSKDLPEIVIAEEELCLIEDLQNKESAILMMRIPQKAVVTNSAANKGELTELSVTILKNDIMSVRLRFVNKFFDAYQYFRTVRYVI